MSRAGTLEDDDRCGRMATTLTPENVPSVESLIKKDPKMTYTEIQDIMKISSHSSRLPWRKKRGARWMSHNLSEVQKWVGWTGAPTC